MLIRQASHYFTRDRSDLEHQISATHRGQAYFANSGPFGATCGDCIFLGYERPVRNRNGDTVRMVRHGGCKKYQELTNKRGPVVPADAAACRYFERKEVQQAEVLLAHLAPGTTERRVIIHKRRSIMDMRRYGAGPVRPEDVRDGPRQEKIVDVSISEKFDCPVLHFESGDSLLLFQANARAMIKAYGPDSNKWLEQIVELSLGHYTGSKTGEEKETVVLTPISVLQPSADNGGTKAALPSVRKDLDDDIPF